MKKILIIAPNSYPVIGAESIVNIKLLKAMSETCDFTIDLISKRSKWHNYPSDSIENLGVNVRTLNIIEVDNKLSVKSIWLHLLSFFFFGVVFKGSHWAVEALKVSKKLIAKNQYDYVLTKDLSSPLVGYYLKKHFNVKWVATFNDPTPVELYPEPYNKNIKKKHSFFTKRYIKILSYYPNFYIFPNNRLRNYLMSYLKINETNTVIIPHIVLKSEITKSEVLQNDILKIIHSGNLKYPRDPKSFFLALKRLIENDMTNIEVTILGVTDYNLESYLKELGIDKFVKYVSPMSYLSSLEYLKEFHIALIIEANCKEGIFLPTKVSDFMQSSKSIFAVSPVKGVLNDLFNEGFVSYFADVTSSDSIYYELQRIYKDFQKGKLQTPNVNIKPEYLDDSVIKQYASF